MGHWFEPCNTLYVRHVRHVRHIDSVLLVYPPMSVCRLLVVEFKNINIKCMPAECCGALHIIAKFLIVMVHKNIYLITNIWQYHLSCTETWFSCLNCVFLIDITSHNVCPVSMFVIYYTKRAQSKHY